MTVKDPKVASNRTKRSQKQCKQQKEMSNLTRGYDYNTDPKGSVEENCLSLESERNFSVPDRSVNGPQVTWKITRERSGSCLRTSAN